MPKKQKRKLKEKITSDILKTLFSKKTTLRISEICIKNGIEEEEKIEEIAHQIGLVLLGKLPPKEFQKTLEEKVKFTPETTEKINREINQTIFYPVKSSLEDLYKIKITPSAKPAKITPPSETTPPPEEKPEAPPREDVYREFIE